MQDSFRLVAPHGLIACDNQGRPVGPAGDPEQRPHPLGCEPAALLEIAQTLLVAHRIGQVAADPTPHIAATRPGGWTATSQAGHGGTVYVRLHGSPRMYY